MSSRLRAGSLFPHEGEGDLVGAVPAAERGWSKGSDRSQNWSVHYVVPVARAFAPAGVRSAPSRAGPQSWKSSSLAAPYARFR